MPEPGRKITIQLDPDDPDSTVELSLVETLETKEGSGKDFQRRITRFNNGENASRVIAIRKITHKKRLPGLEWQGPGQPLVFSDEEDDEDDDEQTIEVEVIFEMTTEEGSGAGFRRRIYKLNWDEESNLRNSHIKRIRNKDDPGIWIDVRRKDQFITFENSGQMYRRRLTSVAWDDGADDNPFDNNALVAEPVRMGKPVRLDFLQDIVNISRKRNQFITLHLEYIQMGTRISFEFPGPYFILSGSGVTPNGFGPPDPFFEYTNATGALPINPEDIGFEFFSNTFFFYVASPPAQIGDPLMFGMLVETIHYGDPP